VAIPTIYIIDAGDEQAAMHQAAERFKHEHHTQFEPELQWAELTGTDTDAEWHIADWGVLPE
jgi:Ser/Thr protein kinase RdoA (MazF antagonist)